MECIYNQKESCHGTRNKSLKPFLSMPSHNQKPILFAGRSFKQSSMILEQVLILNTCPKLEKFCFYAPTSFYKDPFLG